MKKDSEKKRWGAKPPESLEAYLLAAENPIGKKQFRPIFRRKRNREVLTREQVNAIKRGRKLLRKEMKERGLKRRIDFETTATNLGLQFDRNRILWPFFLWLMRDNTMAKILATTAVLTTVVTVTEPLIEYVTQFVTQYVNQYVDRLVQEIVDRIVEKDRFTVRLSDEMKNMGLELSDKDRFDDPSEVLTCVPVWDMPAMSISQLPADILNFSEGENHDTYFAYTFYCRYINLEAERLVNGNLPSDFNEKGMESIYPLLHNYKIDYEWALMIGNESLEQELSAQNEDGVVTAAELQETQAAIDLGVKVSDALWVMVMEDNEVILCAKPQSRDTGVPIAEEIPSREVLEKGLAFMDRSYDYINDALRNIHPALNVDNINHLEDIEVDGEKVFTTESEIKECRDEINAYLQSAKLENLTKLMLHTDDPKARYSVVERRGDWSYYKVNAQPFESEKTIVSRRREEVFPYLRPEMFQAHGEDAVKAFEEQTSIHKYTVIAWLEGDDPECINALMNGHISLNFQIVGDEEDFATEIITQTQPTESTEIA